MLLYNQLIRTGTAQFGPGIVGTVNWNLDTAPDQNANRMCTQTVFLGDPVYPGGIVVPPYTFVVALTGIDASSDEGVRVGLIGRVAQDGDQTNQFVVDVNTWYVSLIHSITLTYWIYANVNTEY